MKRQPQRAGPAPLATNATKGGGEPQTSGNAAQEDTAAKRIGIGIDGA